MSTEISSDKILDLLEKQAFIGSGVHITPYANNTRLIKVTYTDPSGLRFVTGHTLAEALQTLTAILTSTAPKKPPAREQRWPPPHAKNDT